MVTENHKKIFVATYPFGVCDSKPKDILEEASSVEIVYNSLGRRLKVGEVGKFLKGVHGVIAGTELYGENELSQADSLEVISRVGVGLDSINFIACKKHNVGVTYTPEAPSDGVADLAVGQMINLLRGIFISNKLIRKNIWHRTMGRLLSEVKIGILGVGRIGKRVIKRLYGFGVEVFACDINPDLEFGKEYGVYWVSHEELFRICDIVSVHIPLNEENINCVNITDLTNMKEGSFIINTSRGPVVDENALEFVLENKHLGGAALDVFNKEPYNGPLTKFENIILTAHIGSSAHQSRYLMELGAATDCLNVLMGRKPDNPVPNEYWK
ncbi:MAG: hypothetical protein GF329_22155 [Candidatus Lokiarchaeota archaeon]|nr:hypothetical protein [Candidatus Lokiarchaeota archaeon]